MSRQSAATQQQAVAGNAADPGRASSAPSRLACRVVAVDGPAGAGKSTVAARIAARFGLLNLETGAMYRAFAWKALRHQISPDDAPTLEALTKQTTLTLQPGEAGNRVLLDGEDVTAHLRTPEVTQAASRVSVHPVVRAWLVALQRELGASGEGVIMEGRDIGTAVFPDAEIKVFLDASPEARSQRRYEQAGSLHTPGTPNERDTGTTDDRLQAVVAEMRERDHRDRNRADSPLQPAADAVVIDSTILTLDEVVDEVSALITARWAVAPRL